MAKYNTFLVCDSRAGKSLLVTSSARKANGLLEVGKRVEVWNENEKIASITWKSRHQLRLYIQAEKDWLSDKQSNAHSKNNRRKSAQAR